MGGFYGNITDTSKTTFSFDLVYHSRLEMDTSSDEDGIFLGRYVLVDYDDAPIKAYGKKDTDGNVIAFYNTSHFSQNSEIKKKSGVVYEDLAIQENTVSKFYKWTGSIYEPLGKDETPYYTSFETDVKEYGRGYDSTVWVKRFDTNSNKYKYAMIAELNAVVPTLHLVINKPNPSPSTPYFDRDTTNIDYYLHMQGEYGTRIKKLPKQEDMVNPNHSMRSDENIVYNSGKWVTDETGYSIWQENDPEIVPGDIYYNNAGFDPAVRTFSEGTYEYYLKDDLNNNIDGGKKAVVDYGRNQIGFDFGRSGRYYGANADLGVYSDGIQADDIYDWFVRLPGIGNAICKMWDKVYGYRKDNKRYLNDALTYEDKTDNLVSYDRNTMIGVMNTAQDLIGYHFISLDEYNPQEIITWPTDTEEMPSDFLITVNLKYDNEIAEQSAVYEVLKCIFYTTDENGNKKYYAYHYAPDYGEPVEPEFEDENKTIFKDNKIYYYKENDIYHVANPKTYKTTDANGNIILSTSEYYLATPEWKLAPINTIADNSIQTLIAQMHTMLGTNIGEVRDMNSAQGAINTIKDIIANIDINLAPGRLLHTNNSGVIETVGNTYFPSATWDRDEVLDGNGNWVSRFATVKVLENSSNNNQKNPEVNTIIDGSEQNVATVIESDNDKSHAGTSLVNYKKHTTNNLTLGSRNKWIELYGNADKDSIEFKHSQSPIVSRLRAEQAEGSSYTDMFDGITAEENVILKDSTGFKNFSVNDNATEIKVEPTTDTLEYKSQVSDQNDNRLTIPYMTVDNAGHVVELGTKNFNIPNNFKKIATTTIDDDNESASLDQAGISIAETINDTLNLAPRNRWIDIATETTNDEEGKQEDTITWSHRLINDLSKVNDKIEKNGVLVDYLNGGRRSDVNKIQTVYRFGLPQDKSIALLDGVNGNEDANTFNVPYIEIDKAGHVVAAETHIVEIPHTYNKISTGAVINDEALEGKAGHTIDTLANEVTGIKAETLSEEIQFASSNKWIRIDATEDIDTKKDIVKFGHEIHTIIDTKPNLEDLDSDQNEDKQFTTQIVNWDAAGHIIDYGTKTWVLPNSIRNIKVQGIANEKAVNNLEGTEDFTIEADTTSDTVNLSASNIWIRLEAKDNDLNFGHLVREIPTSVPKTDLNDSGTFNVEEYTYDDAGHIRSKAVRELTLPFNYKTVGVVNSDPKNENGITINNQQIIAQNQIDSYSLQAGNKWVQLAAANADISGKDTITIAHSLQGTAGDHVGTDIQPNFGGSVTLYGYKTDAAGHVINDLTYTLTLPKGKYTPTNYGSEGASVITGIDFTDSTGEITSTAINVGTLKLTNYTKLDTTENAAIAADDTINKAFAKLDNRIETEEETRASDINNLRMFKTINVANTDLVADSNADTLTIAAGNDGIVLTPTDTNDSFTIGHKAGHEAVNGFYKLSTDVYGHVSTTSAVELSDLTSLGVATAEDLNTHANTITNFVNTSIANQWISNYSSFEALYNAIVQKLTTDGYIEATGA